jgi:hypothetical protein
MLDYAVNAPPTDDNLLVLAGKSVCWLVGAVHPVQLQEEVRAGFASGLDTRGTT